MIKRRKRRAIAVVIVGGAAALAAIVVHTLLHGSVIASIVIGLGMPRSRWLWTPARARS